MSSGIYRSDRRGDLIVPIGGRGGFAGARMETLCCDPGEEDDTKESGVLLVR